MVPTADQVAHAIVAASRRFNLDPIKVAKQSGGIPASRAMIYALMAIADLWGNDRMACRVMCMTETRAGTTRWQVGKGALRWWDVGVLAKVKAAIPDAPASPPVSPEHAGATTPAPAPETAPLPAARKPVPVPAKRTAPNYGTIGGMGPPRAYSPSRDLIGEKAGLRNMLADAVRNTAKLPSQN